MPVIRISNGIIQEISSDRNTTLLTVTYMDRSQGRSREQTIRLAAGPQTAVLNANGFPVPPSSLRTGMTINATHSSALTRSIPPQARAYVITVVRNRSMPDSMTAGTILDIDRNNRFFTTISDRDFSSIIRFNVSDETVVLNRAGRPVPFQWLTPGMRVRVRHAAFMTASIPPQTAAFEVRML
ncbi:MAG: hypothetical protein IJ468_08625 [Lachnospiraceae bacterium]|nr:hypothetical protein [Lachnospiraceae bacterium]